MSRKRHDKTAKKEVPPPVESDGEGEGQAKPVEAEALAPVPDERDDLQAERDDLFARLQRLGADYQNYQKRVQRDIAQAREFANDQLIKSLLGVLDDMERALQVARDNHGEDDPLYKGMQMAHDKALETLGGFGLSGIEATGKPFDPERHSAMMQQPSSEHPPQTVLQELQKGYQLKGRTIRPAAVIVSTEPKEDEAEDR